MLKYYSKRKTEQISSRLFKYLQVDILYTAIFVHTKSVIIRRRLIEEFTPAPRSNGHAKEIVVESNP